MSIYRILLGLCVLIMPIIAAQTAVAANDLLNADDMAEMANTWQQESPLIINDSTIDSAVSHYPLFVLDCWKDGCKPCKQISPTIDEMAQDFKEKIVFGKLLIDQNYKTRVKYNIYHYPMLLIFKNGTLVYKHLGNYPKETLEGIILSRLGAG